VKIEILDQAVQDLIEVDMLKPDELRLFALKSWIAFVQKEDRTDGA